MSILNLVNPGDDVNVSEGTRKKGSSLKILSTGYKRIKGLNK